MSLRSRAMAAITVMITWHATSTHCRRTDSSMDPPPFLRERARNEKSSSLSYVKESRPPSAGSLPPPSHNSADSIPQFDRGCKPLRASLGTKNSGPPLTGRTGAVILGSEGPAVVVGSLLRVYVLTNADRQGHDLAVIFFCLRRGPGCLRRAWLPGGPGSRSHKTPYAHPLPLAEEGEKNLLPPLS